MRAKHQLSTKNQASKIDQQKTDRVKKVNQLPRRAREGDEVITPDSCFWKYLDGEWRKIDPSEIEVTEVSPTAGELFFSSELGDTP